MTNLEAVEDSIALLVIVLLFYSLAGFILLLADITSYGRPVWPKFVAKKIISNSDIDAFLIFITAILFWPLRFTPKRHRILHGGE